MKKLNVVCQGIQECMQEDGLSTITNIQEREVVNYYFILQSD